AILPELTSSLPAARWTNPSGWHLTLAFLGQVRPEFSAEVVKVGERAVDGLGQAQLRLDGAGGFPHERRARVLWTGVSGDTEVLVTQATRLSAAAKEAGLRFEEREYSPHLTLARLPVPAPLPEPLVGLVTQAAAASPPFQARELCCYRSTPTPRGARYRVVRAFPLTGSSWRHRPGARTGSIPWTVEPVAPTLLPCRSPRIPPRARWAAFWSAGGGACWRASTTAPVTGCAGPTCSSWRTGPARRRWSRPSWPICQGRWGRAARRSGSRWSPPAPDSPGPPTCSRGTGSRTRRHRGGRSGSRTACASPPWTGRRPTWSTPGRRRSPPATPTTSAARPPAPPRG